VGGKRRKRNSKEVKVDRLLQDYLRYMGDFDEARPDPRPRDTDPVPPPNSLPSSKRPTLPEGPAEEDAAEAARIRSDVRAKRERKTTVKTKKSRPR
jgi:hypothetical protein